MKIKTRERKQRLACPACESGTACVSVTLLLRRLPLSFPCVIPSSTSYLIKDTCNYHGVLYWWQRWDSNSRPFGPVPQTIPQTGYSGEETPHRYRPTALNQSLKFRPPSAIESSPTRLPNSALVPSSAVISRPAPFLRRRTSTVGSKPICLLHIPPRGTHSRAL